MNIKWKHINFLIISLSITLLISCSDSKQIQAPKQSDLQFKEAFHNANNEKIIGHNEKAIELFNKCLVLKPNSAASYFALAEIYFSQNNSEKAIEYGKSAFNIDKDNKWYAAFLGDVYFKIGDYHNSANYYDLLVNTHNDRNIDYQSKLAQSFIYSNQKEKAIKVLDKMELVTGSSPITSLTKHDLYLELNKEKLANQSLQKLFDDHQTDVQMNLEIMDYFLQTGQLDKATLAINQIRKIDLNNAKAKVGEAEIALSQVKIDHAFDLLNDALPSVEVEKERKLMVLESLIGMGFDNRYSESNKINKNLSGLLKNVFESLEGSSRYMSLYGEYLMQNNLKDSARDYFEKAVHLNPNDFQTWMSLLDADYIGNNFEQLALDANKALEIYPNQPMIYLLKGIAEFEQNELSKAEETFFIGKELIVEDQAVLSEFQYHIAKNNWMQGKRNNSEFEQLLKNNPQNARFHFGYAQLLHNSEDNKAIEYAEKAAEIDQRNSKHSAFYAFLLFDKKEFAKAKKMIERAIAYDDENVEYLEKYGDIVFFLGDISKALEVWQQTNEIAPSERLQKKINSKSYHD